MRNLILSGALSIVWLTTTGCTSTSMSDPLALIEQEQQRIKGQLINKKVLMDIQALRTSQKATMHTYTFVYDLDNKELSYDDKITISKLLAQQPHAIINIAPANGANKLTQLTLAMERAKILHQYISHFNNSITISFSPGLPTDTINLKVGA